MSLELTARTEAGARLAALADELAAEIAPHAAKHDRDASFPFESFATIKESGYFLAPIPEELGGLGVVSLHDLVVAQSRLARGDAALALGVNMHFVLVLSMAQRWELATCSRRRAADGRLRQVARGDRPRAHGASRPRSASRRRT